MFSNSLAKVERTEEQRHDIMAWSKGGFKIIQEQMLKCLGWSLKKNHKPFKITNTVAKTF